MLLDAQNPYRVNTQEILLMLAGLQLIEHAEAVHVIWAAATEDPHLSLPLSVEAAASPWFGSPTRITSQPSDFCAARPRSEADAVARTRLLMPRCEVATKFRITISQHCYRILRHRVGPLAQQARRDLTQGHLSDVDATAIASEMSVLELRNVITNRPATEGSW
jgi:hypothetical protein